MKKCLLLLAMVFFVLAGCGGGSSTPDVVKNPVDQEIQVPPSVVAKASEYTGSWSGLTGGVPVTLFLAGVDATGVVTGNVYSTKLSGTFTGSILSDGTVAGTVNNKFDLNSWSVVFGKTDTSVTINSATFGAATLGSGSCTATPSLVTDMSGSWVGYMVRKDNTGYVWPSTMQNVVVELAYAGPNLFIGGIVSDGGLSARVKFQVTTGYWFSQIDQASSWGTKIPAPTAGAVLTQGMITSTSVMDTAFQSDPLAPYAMRAINYTTSYDKVWSDTVTAPFSEDHYLYLVRQGGTLICPTGTTWDVVGGKCIAPPAVD